MMELSSHYLECELGNENGVSHNCSRIEHPRKDDIHSLWDSKFTTSTFSTFVYALATS